MVFNELVSVDKSFKESKLEIKKTKKQNGMI